MEKFLVVEPIIVYPPCLKADKEQDCFNCAIQSAGACPSSRGLCVKPYKNHKRGCPNYCKKPDCPPHVPMFDRVFDVAQPIYAMISTFDLGGHISKMKMRHPDWTDTQLLNVLYWQGTAKKNLRSLVKEFNVVHRSQGYYTTTSPEAMGVDVTGTLKRVGVELEWPARKTVCKVAFAGIPHDDTYMDILI